MKTGEKICFGPYTWRILAIEKNQLLLLTEEIIELRDYHNQPEEVSWENCELRDYLNHQFYQQFNSEEQQRILEVPIPNLGNPWYKTINQSNTKDKIFLLSLDEVVRLYFGDSSHLLDFPSPKQRYWFQGKDPNNEKRQGTYLGAPWWWWLRTSGKNPRFTIYVHGDGNIGIQGNGISKRKVTVIHPIAKDTRGGVRPALWIKK